MDTPLKEVLELFMLIKLEKDGGAIAVPIGFLDSGLKPEGIRAMKTLPPRRCHLADKVRKVVPEWLLVSSVKLMTKPKVLRCTMAATMVLAPNYQNNISHPHLQEDALFRPMLHQ